MNVWRDIALFLIVLAVFAVGFYLMTKLDKFLDENRKTMEKENESREPSCIMLTKTLTDEEVSEEIRKFRSIHKESCVVLFDSSHMEASENFEHQILKRFKK